jgi:hypothetical protein
MQKLIAVVWLALLAAVVAILGLDFSRELFVEATRAHPYVMGFVKIALLGTMGELLGGRIVTGRFRLSGIRLHQRALVWGFLGIVFTVVFPVFSFGVEGALRVGLLPGHGHVLAHAFWKSFFMNLIFAFPMMVFHRITDTLIERDELFTVWPLVDVFTSIDWKNMFRVVGLACLWFWIPAHTGTFMLPPEFRVISAALLAVVLGFILGLAKRLSAKSTACDSSDSSHSSEFSDPSASEHAQKHSYDNRKHQPPGGGKDTSTYGCESLRWRLGGAFTDTRCLPRIR